eukprot:scaffold152087_cov18-Tisochrysis_lutea.AAC.1
MCVGRMGHCAPHYTPCGSCWERGEREGGAPRERAMRLPPALPLSLSLLCGAMAARRPLFFDSGLYPPGSPAPP